MPPKHCTENVTRGKYQRKAGAYMYMARKECALEVYIIIIILFLFILLQHSANPKSGSCILVTARTYTP